MTELRKLNSILENGLVPKYDIAVHNQRTKYVVNISDTRSGALIWAKSLVKLGELRPPLVLLEFQLEDFYPVDFENGWYISKKRIPPSIIKTRNLV